MTAAYRFLIVTAGGHAIGGGQIIDLVANDGRYPGIAAHITVRITNKSEGSTVRFETLSVCGIDGGDRPGLEHVLDDARWLADLRRDVLRYVRSAVGPIRAYPASAEPFAFGARLSALVRAWEASVERFGIAGDHPLPEPTPEVMNQLMDEIEAYLRHQPGHRPTDEEGES